MTTHQDTSTEREKRLAAALWHIKYKAVSLADAQVIALEALASRDEAAQQPQGQAVSDEEIDAALRFMGLSRSTALFILAWVVDYVLMLRTYRKIHRRK